MSGSFFQYPILWNARVLTASTSIDGTTGGYVISIDTRASCNLIYKPVYIFRLGPLFYTSESKCITRSGNTRAFKLLLLLSIEKFGVKFGVYSYSIFYFLFFGSSPKYPYRIASCVGATCADDERLESRTDNDTRGKSNKNIFPCKRAHASLP